MANTEKIHDLGYMAEDTRKPPVTLKFIHMNYSSYIAWYTLAKVNNCLKQLLTLASVYQAILHMMNAFPIATHDQASKNT